jgi:hypothetical protein
MSRIGISARFDSAFSTALCRGSSMRIFGGLAVENLSVLELKILEVVVTLERQYLSHRRGY